MLLTKVLYNSCIAHCGFPIFELSGRKPLPFHKILLFFHFSLEVNFEMDYCQDVSKNTNNGRISGAHNALIFAF